MFSVKKLILIYCLVSVLTGFYAVVTQDLVVPFDYHEILNVESLLNPLLYLILGLVVFVFGCGKSESIGSHEFELRYEPTGRYKNLIEVFVRVLQIFIFVYFSLKIYLFFNDIALLDQDEKYLGDKYSQVLLLLQSMLPLLIRGRRWKGFSILVCFALAFLYAWADASRSGVLPLAGLLLRSIIQKKPIAIAYGLIAYFLVLIALYGRSVPNRLNINIFVFLNDAAGYSSSLFEFFISYTFAFSFLQFSYVYIENSGVFDLYDLFYSSIPIPAFFWPSLPNYDNWRVDMYRPMGALSECLRVSVVAFLVFFYLLGVLAGRVDRMKGVILKVLSITIFLMLAVAMFQYNLRSIIWFISFVYILTCVDRFFYKKDKFI